MDGVEAFLGKESPAADEVGGVSMWWSGGYSASRTYALLCSSVWFRHVQRQTHGYVRMPLWTPRHFCTAWYICTTILPLRVFWLCAPPRTTRSKSDHATTQPVFLCVFCYRTRPKNLKRSSGSCSRWRGGTACPTGWCSTAPWSGGSPTTPAQYSRRSTGGGS